MKKPMNQEKETELRQTLQGKMDELSSFHSASYDYVDRQLEFRSGDQWETDVLAERELDDRPSLVLNFTNTYVNRIVNPVRMNPLGIRVNTDDEDLTDLLSGIIKDIEVKSRAQEAYETAHDTQVAAGLGWIRVGLDYEDNESLEQKIDINLTRNPMSIWLDPYSERADGSDAQYGVYVTYMSEDDAEEYGDEATGESVASIDIYEHWQVPEGSVADVTYYEMRETKKKRYWTKDGETLDEEPGEEIEIEAEREIVEKYCFIARFVGNKLVSSMEVPIPYLPIVPVYGDHLHLERESQVRLGGVVHWLKDSAMMANYYASNEMELAALAPKSPWITAEGQIEGYEDIWANANTRSYDTLPYKPTSLNGSPVPPPMRVDNTAQTSGLIASRNQATQDMGRTLGIFDNMLGGMESAQDTGRSILLRGQQGEISTAHYLQNLQQSIAQVGRVIMHLLPYIGDTERAVGVRDEHGKRVLVNMKLKDVITPKLLKNMDVEITSGPVYESRRRESVAAILQIAQVMPEKMGAMADILVRNLDAPGSREIADRLEKLLPPELRDAEEQELPPEVMQEMQAAQMMIAQQQDRMGQLEGVIQQLQGQLISKQKDRETKITDTIIKEEGSLAREKMKQVGNDRRQLEQIEADAEGDIFKAQADMLKQSVPEKDISASIDIDDVVPRAPGPISVPTAENRQKAQDMGDYRD